ncbi:MAG: HlyD family secretion protein [Halieaceae bacterium]|nr:HlyD family secretion protein [Halieaceae bacterium]
MSETTNRTLQRRLLMGAGVAVALAVAAWRLYGGASVDTENAYIKADKISLAAEVSGIISEVPVQANQAVKRGDLLVALDDYAFRLAVAEAEGHLGQVRNTLLARRADYAEAEAALEQARRDADYYRRQLERHEKMGSLAVSEAVVDESRQQLTQARSRIAINEQKLTSLRAELGGGMDVPLEEQADLRVAQAQLDRARYQLSRTRIVAPVDGIVANSVPTAGELAHDGLTLISLISTESMWVEANLKETQLEHIQPGLRAHVEVDAYPGYQWLAEVQSVSPASGSEFALIPAQNASGNWVKVVQRVPVRLRLLQAEEGPPLRSGLSAQVSIELGRDRTEQPAGETDKSIALLQ